MQCLKGGGKETDDKEEKIEYVKIHLKNKEQI